MQNLDVSKKDLNITTALAYIEKILNQLLKDYQNTKLERERIAIWEETQEFSILGTIEVLTDDIRGYSFQIINNNSSAKAQEILNELNKLKIFEIPEFIEWYFTPEFDYPQMKHYAETLNYLRLLIIEYLRDLSPVL
ncbi:MAG: hypothetical protein ACK5EU_04805 [Pseudanabaena sp.]|jgi:hypothetical protein|uniref:hypothetical protein n=1 Tax=Pseudanabaena mucicola TaxID=71190 RepID=UPI00257911C1|nr:hypothetical protein [Pseudanabaena mucicola]MCE2977681.1 hypothetical protein [Pseudanabaena sp. CoA8_M7]